MTGLSDEQMEAFAHELHRRYRKAYQHARQWDDMHEASRKRWKREAAVVDLILAPAGSPPNQGDSE